MTKTSPWQPRRVPHRYSSRQLSEEEKAQQNLKENELEKKCKAIFAEVYPSLVHGYYNWFIIIEPESGDYYIDRDRDLVIQKMKAAHPHTKKMILRINETGVCGRI